MRNRVFGPCVRRALAALAVSLVLSTAASAAAAQGTRTDPYAKETLLTVIRQNVLATSEVVSFVNRRGVDFTMTDDVEAEFKRAGARPEVITAIRDNYRPAPTVMAPAPAPGAAPLTRDEILRRLRGRTAPAAVERDVEQRGVNFQITPAISAEIKAAGGNNSLVGAISTAYRSTPLPSTAPLSLVEIQEMLRKKVAAATVEREVEQRGVNFQITPVVSQQIKAAGGSNSLIGAISTKFRPASTKPALPDKPAITYDDLIDMATKQLETHDVKGASETLQRAVALDESKPTAYALLGDVYLTEHEYDLARDSMRKAIDRGGNALFRGIMHDHAGGSQGLAKKLTLGARAPTMFQGGQFCTGSLFISKADVTFRGDDGQDSFSATTSEIKESDMNTVYGRGEGAFNIKKEKNYNFAPLSHDRRMASIIVELVNSYHVGARKGAESGKPH